MQIKKINAARLERQEDILEQRDYFTVIVADDEAELRESVCQMIQWEEIGFRLVGSAGNGLDALQMVEQLQPDLLLSDIRMPFISGVELARQVRELRPMTQIAFLSGYDDFEYAQKAIEYNVISYLLKPIGIADLTEALVEMHRKIAEKYETIKGAAQSDSSWQSFVIPLLLDELTEERDLQESTLTAQAMLAGLVTGPQEKVEMRVLAMELHSGSQNTADSALAKSVDLILNKSYCSRSFLSGSRILTLLVSDQGFERLSLDLDELVQAMGKVWHMTCSLGVSGSVNQWSKCRIACREAVDGLRFGAPSASGVCYPAEIKSGEDGPTVNLAEQSSRLETLIRAGTRADLEQHLQDFFSGTAGTDLAVIEALSVVQRVLQGSISAAQTMQLRRRCHLPENLFVQPVSDLSRKVSYLCLAARELLSEKRKDGMSLLCDQALDAINQNYMDEQMSLGSVSALLHVSPNYLSANMKKYAGDTFINLLIKKRMEVAGELLKTTNLKILEVARRCGYSDQHYFSYCFKKYYGLSPVQLRRGGKETGDR